MSKNKTLFADAIADAKSIREAALINAKAALEEALGPKLESMLNAKLDELDENETPEGLDEFNESDVNEGEDFDLSEILAELNDETEEESLDETKKEDEEDDKAENEEEEGEEATEDEAEDEKEVKDLTIDELKELIKDTINQELEAGEGTEGTEEFPADNSIEGAEELPTGDETPIVGDEAGEDDDEINLDELLAELDALDEAEDDKKDEVLEVKKEDEGDLQEALETIKTLKNNLSEINLLNAKLLYVNKIFKAHNLSETQKLKVIASFDKTKNAKDAQLMFESIKTSFKPKKQSIRENLGFASKAAGIAPKKNVIEVDETVNRWQKLANIKA